MAMASRGRSVECRISIRWRRMYAASPNMLAACGRQATGEAGKLLKFGSLPQRRPKVGRTQRDTGNGAQLVERWCRRPRLPRSMQFEYAPVAGCAGAGNVSTCLRRRRAPN